MTAAGYIQDHADAVLDLLRSVPALTVFEEIDGGPTTIPSGTVPPYVTVHMVAARTIGPDLSMRSTRMSVRIYTYSVGENDVAARAVSDLVAGALLDQKPFIDGRVVFPIRQEVGNDPREDESIGSTVVTITETWRLDTLPRFLLVVTVWCWVRSTGTGHHFDVSLERLDVLLTRGAVVEIPGRRRRSAHARKPKPFVDLRSIHQPRNRKGNP